MGGPTLSPHHHPPHPLPAASLIFRHVTLLPILPVYLSLALAAHYIKHAILLARQGPSEGNTMNPIVPHRPNTTRGRHHCLLLIRTGIYVTFLRLTRLPHRLGGTDRLSDEPSVGNEPLGQRFARLATECIATARLSVHTKTALANLATTDA